MLTNNGQTISRIEKKIMTKDVFYNNGLVNVYQYLQNNKIDGLEYVPLRENCLIIKMDQANETEIYNKLLINFITENEIVFFTKNDRIYWDVQGNSFVIGKRFDVKGRTSGNDVKYLYEYVSAEEIGLTTESFMEKFKEFARAENLKDKEIVEFEKYFINEKTGGLKSDDKKIIPVLMTIEKGSIRFAKYLAEGERLFLDSKIHQFEDGGFCFRDMLNNRDLLIDRWDALVYWYGARIKRLYNMNYFIYLHSNNLKSLYELKKYLRINDNRRTVEDRKTGDSKEIPTNIDFAGELRKIGVENQYFYISKSQTEFQLKTLIYLFSVLFNREQAYEGAHSELLQKMFEPIYKAVKDISFVTYTEDKSSMKTNLTEYTRIYRLFQLFAILIDTKSMADPRTTFFKYLTDLIVTISFAKTEKEENLNLKDFTENILSFRSLRKNYYEAGYDSLKNNKRFFGTNLGEFERVYLNFIYEGSGQELSLHEKAKILGDEIGRFLADIDEENLLFRLRNVKNYHQMVAFFKDLKYSVLRNKDKNKASLMEFSKEFKDTLFAVFTELESDENRKNWELIRDYVAIYAVDKYRSVKYAKEKEKKGE